MREIKFRAWDKGSNSMHTPLTLQEIYQVLKAAQTGEVGLQGFAFAVTFPELIFMQYTGLKDKNGKEIYEGDIITFLDSVGKVIYFESYASFVISYGDNFNDLHNITTQEEIIGNIYENAHEIKDNN